MSPITTHILDTSSGKPAAGVPVTLEFYAQTEWKNLGAGKTDTDGRIKDLLASDHKLEAGTYRLTFAVKEYSTAKNAAVFYPEIQIVFVVQNTVEHYHVPLLLSGFGYSTYRGS